MSNVCSICDQVPTFPIKLSCDDIFCFLCIKTHIIISSIGCPKCGKFVSDDLNNVLLNEVDDDNVFVSTVYWMYSSNVGNFWWCYDKITARIIENMFQHYNNLKNNCGVDNKVPEDDCSAPDIDVDLKNIRVGRSRIKKVGMPEKFQSVASISYEPVNFDSYSDSSTNSDSDNDSDSNSDDDSKSEDVNSGNYDGNMYSVNIGKMKYRIDFDTMKQINLLDVYKKRTIRRVVVPDSVSNIAGYLKNDHRVLGIAGIKF